MLDENKINEAEDKLFASIVPGSLPHMQIALSFYQKSAAKSKAELEANGFSCVILKKPEVTKADAYASAFAITTDCDEENYERAMEIIYAINTDSYLRNMLQFGVKNTNYYLDENNFVTFATGESEYIMDLKYTGDLFLAHFVEGVYTPDTKFYGEKQNLEASYTPVQ
jgi:hypothetical protein